MCILKKATIFEVVENGILYYKENSDPDPDLDNLEPIPRFTV